MRFMQSQLTNIYLLNFPILRGCRNTTLFGDVAFVDVLVCGSLAITKGITTEAKGLNLVAHTKTHQLFCFYIFILLAQEPQRFLRLNTKKLYRLTPVQYSFSVHELAWCEGQFTFCAYNYSISRLFLSSKGKITFLKYIPVTIIFL